MIFILGFIGVFLLIEKKQKTSCQVEPDEKNKNTKSTNYVDLKFNIGQNGKICFSENICLEEKHLRVLRGEAPISIAGYTNNGKGYSRHLAIGRDGTSDNSNVRSMNESTCDNNYHHAFRLISPVLSPSTVPEGKCAYYDHPNTGLYPQTNAVNLTEWSKTSGGKWP